MKKNYSLIKIIPVICLLITLIINNYFRESHLNTLIYILLIFSSISIFIQGKKNMLNKKSVRMLFIALLISIVIFIFQFQS
jgi:glucose-6-phosphate-specific signal transduction histidine kinase